MAPFSLEVKMGHANRGRLTVDLLGNWQQFSPRLTDSDSALGTVEFNGVVGALVQADGGDYFQVCGEEWIALNDRKVSAAIGAAQ